MQQFTKNIETPHWAKIISYEDSKKEKEVAIEYRAEKIQLNGIIPDYVLENSTGKLML